MSARQITLYRAANAAGFATVWHDDAAPVSSNRIWDRLVARFARVFG